MRPGLDRSSFRCTCASYICAVILGGCGAPDPRTVDGTLELAGAAIEARDAPALYPLLDRRARAALASVVKDRGRAVQIVQRDFPPQERAQVLAALGDAARVSEPSALFALRCPEACLRELGAGLGAPLHVREEGPELVVTTTRGTVRMFRDREARVGLVWRTAELAQERLRANRELQQLDHNAAIYRRRVGLEAALRP